MKRLLVLGLVLSMVLANAVSVYAKEETAASSVEEADAAAAEEEADTEAPAADAEADAEAPDLTGDWIQKEIGEDGSYQAGYIRDGVIEIFWMRDGGASGDVYWSGTYETPSKDGEAYSWESENNRIRTGYALLASREDTQKFVYEDEEIHYDVSIMGQNIPVVLVRSEEEITVDTPAGGQTGAVIDGLPVEYVDGQYSWYKRDGDKNCNLYYSVQIHNPNDEYAVLLPTVQVTARAKDGTVLTTHEEVLPYIAAGDTITYGSALIYEGESPEKVEMIVGNDEGSYVRQEESGAIRQDMLAITNLSEMVNAQSKTYTGEVVNNSTVNQSRVSVVIVFKQDGASIGGVNTVIDSVASGGTRPFEITVFNDIIEYDAYEVYALPWAS